jgi:hypothetical protein
MQIIADTRTDKYTGRCIGGHGEGDGREREMHRGTLTYVEDVLRIVEVFSILEKTLFEYVRMIGWCFG